MPGAAADLADRYPLTEVPVPVGGRVWSITAVQDQDALVESVRTEEDLATFPFGLMLWAAAIGLAERLTEEPSLVAGKRVLELGAGVGLPGLVAATLGAAEVTQTDYQEDALELARRNARANRIHNIAVRQGDWRRFFTDGLPYDLVIASDVLYERTLHAPLAALLPRLIAPHGAILLSDPLRPQAMEFLEKQIESGGAWNVAYEGRRVTMPGDKPETKDIALIWLRRKQA
ncbi:MAG: methyltransferase domain-containing protein [Armatimonadota bacterium]